MKKLRIFWLAVIALVAGSFVSCDDTDYTAGPKDAGAQVYFAAESASQTFNIGDEENSIKIPVMRIESEESLTVGILSDAGEQQDLFNIPESVTFAAGEKAVDLVISFDRTALEDGTEYPIDLMINDDNVTSYGRSQIGISIVPWPWEKMGIGKFRDDYMTAMYGGTGEEIDVTIHKHKTREGIYMIEEMFGWDYLMGFFGGTKEQIEAKYFTYTPTNITIDCSDPNKVLFARQQTGMVDIDPSYGGYEIATAEYGTLVDGIITFPTNGLILYCLKGGMYANKNGTFRIILPGFEAVDYSLAAAYAGMQVGADNQTAKPVIDFTYGADVTGIGYTFVSGDVTAAPDEYIAGIVDGTDENAAKVADFEVGAGKVSIKADLTPGIYTLVAVPQDKNEAYLAGSAAVCQFFFPGIGAGSHPCEVEVMLGKVSENAPDYADQCPEYSSIYYKITGADIKSAKRYFNKTELIEAVKNGQMAGQGIADLQALMDQYGAELSADQIAEINETGSYWNIAIQLDAATSFTMLIEAENIYGEKALIESNPFATEAMPYAGELKIGDYKMSYTENYTDASGNPATELHESVFTISPTAGSDTKFTVKNLGVEDGLSWHATYDPDASTLTLDGTLLGKESYGCMFGQIYGNWNANYVYGLASFAAENGTGHDPAVFTVDATTKQVNGLSTTLAIYLYSQNSSGSYDVAGYIMIWNAGSTTIVPYAEAAASAAKASLKPLVLRPVDAPLSNVRISTLPRNNFASAESAVVRETPANVGSRTLSVKTAKCDPLPKKLTRKANINGAAARSLME